MKTSVLVAVMSISILSGCSKFPTAPRKLTPQEAASRPAGIQPGPKESVDSLSHARAILNTTTTQKNGQQTPLTLLVDETGKTSPFQITTWDSFIGTRFFNTPRWIVAFGHWGYTNDGASCDVAAISKESGSITCLSRPEKMSTTYMVKEDSEGNIWTVQENDIYKATNPSLPTGKKTQLEHVFSTARAYPILNLVVPRTGSPLVHFERLTESGEKLVSVLQWMDTLDQPPALEYEGGGCSISSHDTDSSSVFFLSYNREQVELSAAGSSTLQRANMDVNCAHQASFMDQTLVTSGRVLYSLQYGKVALTHLVDNNTQSIRLPEDRVVEKLSSGLNTVFLQSSDEKGNGFVATLPGGSMTASIGAILRPSLPMIISSIHASGHDDVYIVGQKKVDMKWIVLKFNPQGHETVIGEFYNRPELTVIR